MSSNSVLQHSFCTCEEFSQAIAARRSVAIRQLSLSTFRCNVLLIESDLMQFSFFTELSVPIHAFGPKTNGYLEFGFILQPTQQEVFSHQVVVSHNTLFGFDSSREANLIVPAKSETCIVQIKQEAFEVCAHIMERDDLNSHFLKLNYVVIPESISRIHSYLKELRYLATYSPNFLKCHQSAFILVEDFLPLLIDAIPRNSSKHSQLLHTPRRFNLIKQADQYVQANLTKPITLTDICKALNTSERPLSYGFKEVFGISPMAYLKVLRLQEVRKRLKSADPTTTVIAELANQFGFWSLGHFCRDYKKMFGESPSETLKQIEKRAM